MNGKEIAIAGHSGIRVKDHREHGEIVLEQERIYQHPEQVWIKANHIEELIKILQSLV
jgi:hypothetical protein